MSNKSNEIIMNKVEELVQILSASLEQQEKQTQLLNVVIEKLLDLQTHGSLTGFLARNGRDVDNLQL